MTASGAQAVLLTTVKGSPEQMWLQLPGSNEPCATSDAAENWWSYLAG